MCGIAGAWEFRGKTDTHALERMRDGLMHRGPDDQGIFVDPRGQLGLSHCRLSIIDLSQGGHQPMTVGDLTVSYNGEIYNFAEIKKELERLGAHFASNSDTEVLLRAWERWGPDAVQKFRGMFAFALWDAKKETLTLCRDRAGVKPLYYYHDGERLIFASELQVLARHRSVKKEVDEEAVALYLWLGFIPGARSIFERIYKVEPGHLVEVKAGGPLRHEKYWDIADLALNPREYPQEEGALLQELEGTLEEAFKLRMVSDVPVGVFLSGGIDSSLVAALLMKNAARPLMTFTVGFDEKEYDEADHARAVARHLGTVHHEIRLTKEKGAEIIDRLPEMFGEPFGGASAIPTFLVSEFARKEVTVALSADGGDELFCGYGTRYPSMAALYEKYRGLPALMGSVARLIPESFAEGSPRLELLQAQGNLGATFAALNKRMFAKREVRALMRGRASANFTDEYYRQFEVLSGLEPAAQLQLFDFKTNFAENILTKVDRASMAVALESREPFLDPEVMRFAAALPTALKCKGGDSKYLLKQILYKHVPQALVDRPKHGFSMPIRQLLQASPVNFVEEYLGDGALKKESILDPQRMREERKKFLAGRAKPHRLWRLLMFRMWEERFLR